MGYYSDAALAINKEAFTKLMLESALPSGFPTTPTRSTALTLYWVWISWFEEVEAVNQLIAYLEEHDATYATQWGFLRIGEEWDDFERRGDPSDFDLYLNRSIDVPF